MTFWAHLQERPLPITAGFRAEMQSGGQASCSNSCILKYMQCHKNDFNAAVHLYQEIQSGYLFSYALAASTRFVPAQRSKQST